MNINKLSADELRNALVGLPQVAAAIKEKAAQEEAEELARRVALIDSIISGEMEVLAEEKGLAKANVELEKALSGVQSARSVVLIAESKVRDARAKVGAAAKRLHACGEAHQRHAQSLISSRIDNIQKDVASFQAAVRDRPKDVIGMVRAGRAAMEMFNSAELSLARSEEELSGLMVAFEEVLSLSMARISPSDMKAKTQSLLESVGLAKPESKGV